MSINLKTFMIREVGGEAWDQAVGCDMYEAAETYTEANDESGEAFGNGIKYEVRNVGSEDIRRVNVHASASFNAYDAVNPETGKEAPQAVCDSLSKIWKPS